MQPLHPPPPEQMRARLEVARRRGTPFARAWAHAMREIHFVGDWDGRRLWREALEATVDEWRAAYLREPPVIPGVACLASERLGVAAPA